MLKVYCLSINNKVADVKLPSNVSKHCNKYKNKKMVKISRLGWSHLLDKLKNEFKYDFRKDKVLFSKNGKPYLKSKKYYFSLSHSLNLIAFAISNKNVGVDIETKIPKSLLDLLSKRILNDKQYKSYNKSKDKSTYLTKFWTQKEAMIKYSDSSLFDNMKIKKSLSIQIKDNKNNKYWLSIIN